MITTRSRRCTSPRATSSVVVPTFRITEQPSGIIRAVARADRLLLRRRHRAPLAVGGVRHPAGQHRAAVHPRQQPAVAEFVQVAADRLGGDVEFGRQPVDFHAAVQPRAAQDLGLPFGEFHPLLPALATV